MRHSQVLEHLNAHLLTHAAENQWRPDSAFARAVAFFVSTPVDDCLGPDQDMLLFQWGVYDWGAGESFEMDLTRQFVVANRGGPSIYQLPLTFRYPPAEVLRQLGAGEEWCASRGEASRFLANLQASPQLSAVQQMSPASIRFEYEEV